MKLRIISDIHLEFGGFKLPWLATDEDSVLVLAGDIALGSDAADWIEYNANRFRHVIYVLGNHEYYNQHMEEVQEYWANHEIENLTVLENATKVIDDVRFIGGTLWTDFNANDWFACQTAKSSMNDFRRVGYKGKRLVPTDTSKFHAETKAYIINELKDGFDGKTVVVTHHLPHMECVDPIYKNSPLNPAFVSDLSELFDEEMDIWIHGHTHSIVDMDINGTRVICNPRGYAGYESNNNDHNPTMVVGV